MFFAITPLRNRIVNLGDSCTYLFILIFENIIENCLFRCCIVGSVNLINELVYQRRSNFTAERSNQTLNLGNNILHNFLFKWSNTLIWYQLFIVLNISLINLSSKSNSLFSVKEGISYNILILFLLSCWLLGMRIDSLQFYLYLWRHVHDNFLFSVEIIVFCLRIVIVANSYHT